jgi:hypothetical protein
MTKVVFGPALASVGSTCLPFEPDGKGFVSLWSSRKTIGQVINMIWIFFNAVLPCVFEIDLPLPDSLFSTETTT